MRQHIVALMRPIAFAAAGLNVALHDGAVSPIPAISTSDLDASAARSVAAPAQRAERSGRAALDDRDDVIRGEVAA